MFWHLICLGLVFGFLLFVKKRYFGHRDCPLTDRLDGKVVVVTGANSGIGLETVGLLARRGARVIMACRDLDKAHHSRLELLSRFGPHMWKSTSEDGITTPIEEEQLICEQLDLSSIQSIRQFSARLLNHEPVIHILVNNAGVNLGEAHFMHPEDGIEDHIRINYLGHFLLTELLLPALKQSGQGRILNVSSVVHLFAELDPTNLSPVTGPWYAVSKLLNVMHARSLTQRLANSDVVAISLHPGLVKTGIFRHSWFNKFLVYNLFSWLAKSSTKGAQTTLYCALSDDLSPGAFYWDCQTRTPCSQALDDSVCAQVHDLSQTLITRWETGI